MKTLEDESIESWGDHPFSFVIRRRKEKFFKGNYQKILLAQFLPFCMYIDLRKGAMLCKSKINYHNATYGFSSKLAVALRTEMA